MNEHAALFKDGDQRCPGCGAVITFQMSNGGLTVEVLHPQPPCSKFRAFVERLLSLHAPN